MCDLGPLSTSLLIAAGLIVASVAAVATAAVLNGGFFSAPGSPLAMAAAAAFATAAGVLLVTAQNRLLEFFNCIGAPEACQGNFNDLNEALEAMAGILFAQALAAIAVALVAWIPWAAQPAMYVIATSLLAQLAFIPIAITYVKNFLECVESIGAITRPLRVPNPLIVAAILVVIALPIIHVSRRRKATVG